MISIQCTISGAFYLDTASWMDSFKCRSLTLTSPDLVLCVVERLLWQLPTTKQASHPLLKDFIVLFLIIIQSENGMGVDAALDNHLTSLVSGMLKTRIR